MTGTSDTGGWLNRLARWLNGRPLLPDLDWYLVGRIGNRVTGLRDDGQRDTPAGRAWDKAWPRVEGPRRWHILVIVVVVVVLVVLVAAWLVATLPPEK